MTAFKLNVLCAVATCVALAGGFGLYAIQADDKKPAGAKPAIKPDGEKPKPAKPALDGEKPKPAKPDGEKKPARQFKIVGQVAEVDAKANTVMLATKGDGGVVEKVYPLAAGAKVFVDGKEAKLAEVPKNAFAAGIAVAAARDGELPQLAELRVTGRTHTGVVKEVDATTIALESEKKPQVFKVAADTKVTVNGKDAKATDLKVGDKVVITLTADSSAALSIATGVKGDGEKPGIKNPKFAGKVLTVDATARTVTLFAKGEGGKEVVVKVTADAKITVDGKNAKIGDIQKGMVATFNLISAKDGQPREANEVSVAGPTFGGSVKQIDTTTITVGSEKADRVFKLLPTTKVTINGKGAKSADLKAGDRVMVTLTADETGAVLIASGAKKPTGDKPKPDKEEDQ